MTTILSEVEGFTPVIDVIVGELGLMPALVYGVAWRYCQMEDGVCKANLETIAKRIGVSRATVKRNIKILRDEGYLVDTTPDRKHKPHVYADAGKVRIAGLLAARQQCQAESGQERPSLEVGQKDPPSEEVGPRDPPGRVGEIYRGGSERPAKILSEDTDQETRTASRDASVPTRFQDWQKIVRETKNRPAALRRMFVTLFPEADPPDFGYIGKTAKTVGGAGRLAELMWTHSAKPPTGDPLRFLMGVAKRQGGNNGAHRGGGARGAADHNTPTEEQTERNRAALRARREEHRA